MARVVLAAEISGTRNGKEWPAIGSEVDLPDAEAADMVKAGTAVAPDDERVAHLRGYVASDIDLAGAPSGRDITEGQPDTNLARARALAQENGGDAASVRKVTRAAAKRADYTDELTVPGRSGGPKVGDDQEAPVDAVEDPTNLKTAKRGKGDGASGLVEAGDASTETADASTAGEERAISRF